ncbi:MAG: 2-oxoacid:acceptor oxidoreductase subunit alpha [Methanomicrobiales archaeon]|nr:2-oxoacid:acceptor oxidoreductase subunit alpha [Methanomicrobiales archaeon]
MNDISVLIGGKAGDGINSAGLTIAHLFNHLGYRVYIYFDYPSLIKGGHNFAIVRASDQKIGAHRETADFLLALNNDTIDVHTGMIRPDTEIIFDAGNATRATGTPVPVSEILTAENAPPIMGNSALIGAFAKTAGIQWDVITEVFRRHLPKDAVKNLSVARKAYDAAQIKRTVPVIGPGRLPIITGNEAMGLGLIHGGMDAYISYPMTPTSNILHFLAEQAPHLPITVVHPENEIGVIIMALGCAYAGKKTAVGTSGGGFCLMTEGLSFAGQSEIPVVIVVGQRTGPGTGLPTYTGQSDLHFVLHAGQGEFCRLVVAPGDAEESYGWSSLAVQLAWKYQVPAIILGDKTLHEGTYSFDRKEVEGYHVDPGIPGEELVTGQDYRRYRLTGSGVSPCAFPGTPDTVVKITSYTHDENGISTEDAKISRVMAEKRKKKGARLLEEIDRLLAVMTYGDRSSPVALLAWGSNKGVACDVAGLLGLRVIQPVVLSPFPLRQMKEALSGVTRLVSVEDNMEGQMGTLLRGHGITVDDQVLKYDGRPFFVDELYRKVMEVLK